MNKITDQNSGEGFYEGSAEAELAKSLDVVSDYVFDKVEDYSSPGRFKTFYPQRRKKK